MSLATDAATTDEIDLILDLPGHPTIEVPVWVVVVEDEVVVRSYTGPNARWYRRAVRHPEQSIRVDGRVVAVTFERMPATQAVNDAYDEKYARFDYVGSMSKPQAAQSTLRITSR